MSSMSAVLQTILQSSSPRQYWELTKSMLSKYEGAVKRLVSVETEKSIAQWHMKYIELPEKRPEVASEHLHQKAEMK